MTNWANDPDWQDFRRHVLADALPKLMESAYVMSILPTGEPDVKFAVELGLGIMLDKPLILVVAEGTHVPAKLALVAETIVEYNGTPEDLQAQLVPVMERLRAERG